MNHSIDSAQCERADPYHQKVAAARLADAGISGLTGMIQEAVGKKPSEISEAHKVLTMSVDSLHQTISMLARRLEPVTSPAVESAAKDASGKAASSPLGRAIYEQTALVQEAERRLRDILNRLALE